MREKCDVILFAEDPGALAYIEPLAGSLRSLDYAVTLAAAGIAAKLLIEKGTPFVDIQEDLNATDFLMATCPRLVVSGTAENPQSRGLSLISAAHALKIKTVGAVDAPMNAEKRFSGLSPDPLEHKPDYIVVPDESCRAEFVNLGFPSENIFALGHPQFDVVLSKLSDFESRGKKAMRSLLFPSVHEEKKIIIFLDEGPKRLNILSENYLSNCTLRGVSDCRGRTEIALEEFLISYNKLKEDGLLCHLILRLHPKSTKEDFSQFQNSVNEFHSGGSALDAIFCSDLVVGSTTILLLESTLLGRSTLSIVPKKEEGNWLISVRNGATPCAWTSADIPLRLNEASSKNGAEEETRALQRLFTNSTKRITDFLNKLLD